MPKKYYVDEIVAAVIRSTDLIHQKEKYKEELFLDKKNLADLFFVFDKFSELDYLQELRNRLECYSSSENDLDDYNPKPIIPQKILEEKELVEMSSLDDDLIKKECLLAERIVEWHNHVKDNDKITKKDYENIEKAISMGYKSSIVQTREITANLESEYNQKKDSTKKAIEPINDL